MSPPLPSGAVVLALSTETAWYWPVATGFGRPALVANEARFELSHPDSWMVATVMPCPSAVVAAAGTEYRARASAPVSGAGVTAGLIRGGATAGREEVAGGLTCNGWATGEVSAPPTTKEARPARAGGTTSGDAVAVAGVTCPAARAPVTGTRVPAGNTELTRANGPVAVTLNAVRAVTVRPAWMRKPSTVDAVPELGAAAARAPCRDRADRPCERARAARATGR